MNKKLTLILMITAIALIGCKPYGENLINTLPEEELAQELADQGIGAYEAEDGSVVLYTTTGANERLVVKDNQIVYFNDYEGVEVVMTLGEDGWPSTISGKFGTIVIENIENNSFDFAVFDIDGNEEIYRSIPIDGDAFAIMQNIISESYPNARGVLSNTGKVLSFGTIAMDSLLCAASIAGIAISGPVPIATAIRFCGGLLISVVDIFVDNPHTEAALTIAHTALSPSVSTLQTIYGIANTLVKTGAIWEKDREDHIYSVKQKLIYPEPFKEKIIFASNRDGNTEIYTMDTDGLNQARITDNPASDYAPAWSPDGTKIVFSSKRDGNTEIYVMDADGSNEIRLTNTSTKDTFPMWCPDGSKIVFESYEYGNPEICTINIDGSNTVRLTNNSSIDNAPAWSPDGTKIVFSSLRSSYLNIYVMDDDGSNEIRLTNTSGINYYYPAWSPDGTKIVFSFYAMGYYGIGIMDADGSNRIALISGNSREERPAWSPGGTKIVFHSERDGNAEIYVMDADGSNQERLTNNSYYDGHPSWSPVK